MSEGFVPWDSQDLDRWAGKYARGQFADLGGHKTHYLELGKGEPLILIHGFNLDLNTWMTNLGALSSRYRIYAPDLWGLGFSTREPLDYGYDLFVEQVRLFMDHLGVTSAFIAGHSMGGGTAIEFSNRYPERVRGTILVGSTGYPRTLPLRGKLFQLPVVAEIVLGLRTDVVRKMNYRDYWIHRHDLLTEEVYTIMVRFQKIKGTTKSLLAILRKNFFFTLGSKIEQLSDTEIPFLIIWGLNDHTVPVEDGEKIHRSIKRSHFEVLENAGHWVNFDQAEKFNQLVLEFLDDLVQNRN